MTDEVELSAGGIPVSLKPFFQEYDFGRLDAERHRDLVIERTLNYGNRREVRWLFDRYGREPIAAWVQERGAARLSRRRFSCWQTVLSITDFQRPRYWRQTIWPY
ncbi:MAG TPA: hypothetical protein VJ754_02870 [Anaerolineae bacterium]|nr:hypothetical protein [Anaerolineae bacterium]